MAHTTTAGGATPEHLDGTQGMREATPGGSNATCHPLWNFWKRARTFHFNTVFDIELSAWKIALNMQEVGKGRCGNQNRFHHSARQP